MNAGKAASVYFSGYDLTSYLDEYQAGALTLQNEETPVFKNNSKTRLPIIGDAQLSIGGYYDKTDDGSEEALATLDSGSSDTYHQIMILPEADTVGNPVIASEVVKSAWNFDGPHIGVVRVDAQLNSRNAVEVSVILKIKEEETATFTDASLDQTAQSTDGAVAFLQVFAAAGTTLDVDIEDSDDDSTFTTLASFTQVTSAPAHERIEISGTIERYVRVVGTLVGGAFTLAVAFRRN